jgi:hypothetical protein
VLHGYFIKNFGIGSRLPKAPTHVRGVVKRHGLCEQVGSPTCYDYNTSTYYS